MNTSLEHRAADARNELHRSFERAPIPTLKVRGEVETRRRYATFGAVALVGSMAAVFAVVIAVREPATNQQSPAASPISDPPSSASVLPGIAAVDAHWGIDPLPAGWTLIAAASGVQNITGDSDFERNLAVIAIGSGNVLTSFSTTVLEDVDDLQPTMIGTREVYARDGSAYAWAEGSGQAVVFGDETFDPQIVIPQLAVINETLVPIEGSEHTVLYQGDIAPVFAATSYISPDQNPSPVDEVSVYESAAGDRASVAVFRNRPGGVSLIAAFLAIYPDGAIPPTSMDDGTRIEVQIPLSESASARVIAIQDGDDLIVFSSTGVEESADLGFTMIDQQTWNSWMTRAALGRLEDLRTRAEPGVASTEAEVATTEPDAAPPNSAG